MKQILQDDFYNFKFLSNLNYSTKGTSIICNVKKVDAKENGYKNSLYINKGKGFKKLIDDVSNYIYRNDNELLLFAYLSKEDKERVKNGEQFTSIYSLKLDEYQPEKIAEIPVIVESVKMIDENKLIFSSTIDKNYPDYYKLSNKERNKINEEYKNNRDYEVIDETPFWFNEAGFVNGKRTALFIYDFKTKKLERITEPLFTCGAYEIVEDKIYIAGQKQIDKMNPKDSIIVYDMNTKETTSLVKDDKYSIYAIGQLKDKLIVLATEALNYGLNEDPILYVYDSKTKDLSKFFTDNLSYGNSVGSDCRLGGGRSMKICNDKLYFVETKRNRAILNCLDENGNLVCLFDEEGSVDDFDIYENQIVLTLLKADSLQEVYSLKNDKLVKISNFNSLKDKYVALPNKLTIDSEGIDIDGWVLLPKDYDKNKKYPAILDIHGGPKTVYGEVYYHEMQIWASLGYFVFFCNPTGSDGRGNEFSDIRGKYGTIDYQNIMDFTDEVLKKYPQIDKSKICVTGGSYGGFMTNWIVGHTDRFVAAATQRSISNWISFEGVSDIGHTFAKDQTAGCLLGDIEKAWQQSPLKYVQNVKTPILFIHSDEDYRCPLEQGVQYYSAIKNNNVECKMVIFHGENHELSRGGKPLHRSKRLKEITDWFNAHI